MGDDVNVRRTWCVVRGYPVRGWIEPDFLVLLLPAEALREHGQRALQVRQQRRIGPRRRQRVEIDVRGKQRFFE